jgi:hypothetical protein
MVCESCNSKTKHKKTCGRNKVITVKTEDIITLKTDDIITVKTEDIITVKTEDIITLKTEEDTNIILSKLFSKCILGYHLVNNSCIKETLWEDINIQILNASNILVSSSSNGSHQSGADIVCSLGKLSNKSSKYNKNHFQISSYRLTTMCSAKNYGIIDNIIAEIDRRKNFNYYSIIVRECDKDVIKYDWYMIPSDCPLLLPSTYKWEYSYNKSNTINGWKTNIINGSSMKISFAMSSQLWINVNVSDVKKYIISSCVVVEKQKYNYIQLYNILTDSNAS